jgi:hypothetical protein
MSSSSSSTLPLVRTIALLPDDRFFTTTVALADGQEAGSVAAQVELALEAVSPFPVAQLYQGHFTRPGAKRALAFAAYRKRFAAEETALWTAAELVTPAFVVLLGAPEGISGGRENLGSPKTPCETRGVDSPTIFPRGQKAGHPEAS